MPTCHFHHFSNQIFPLENPVKIQNVHSSRYAFCCLIYWTFLKQIRVARDTLTIIVYQDIFTPYYFRFFHPNCQQRNLRLGNFIAVFKLLCLLESISHNCVWVNSKLFASIEEREKNHRAKITLYTVFWLWPERLYSFYQNL